MSKKDYQIGLDLGVASIGWAVVDDKNRLIKKRGKNLWGVRLFDEAKSAEERRLKRRQRRTLSKRSWRLHLLKEELKNYVLQEDPEFFIRLKNSQTKPEEGYLLFDGEYDDVKYMREFPTIFHLRLALMDEEQVRQIKKRNIYYRLLFLATNDILKTRGHFLTEGKLDSKSVASKENILHKLKALLENINEQEIILEEKMIVDAIDQLLDGKDDINKRKQDSSTIFLKAILGYKFNINKIIEYNEEKYDLSFNVLEWEKKLTNVEEIDNMLNSLYEIYAMIRLFLVLKNEPNISSAKIKIYDKHKIQLEQLKNDLKEIDKILKTTHFHDMFEEVDLTKPSYTLYVGKAIIEGQKISVLKKTKYEDLIKKLIAIKTEIDAKQLNNKYLKDIEEDGYLAVPTNTDNRLIPYQIHYLELEAILNNFVKLETTDKSEKHKENILKIMEFKVPYYVGPLANKIKEKENNYWLVKNKGYEKEKITPYNFDLVVDKKRTNEQFIKRMLRNCTYLHNEQCMQQETVLYQTYIFYNTVNKIKIDGEPLDNQQKEILFNALIKSSSLTKKKLLALVNKKNAEVTGFSKTDEEKPLSISLSAVKKFRNIFPNQIDNEFYQEFYDDVVNEISFIDDNETENKISTINEILKSYKTIELNEEQINLLTKVKSQKWGNLSYRFLKELLFMKDNKTGEMATIMEILKTSNMNLMEILFVADNMNIIDNENDLDVNLSSLDNVHEYLKRKYITPQARRTIMQAVRIIDEIVEIMGGEKPTNIAIEFTRENQKDKRETSPRLRQLQNAYKNVGEEYKSVVLTLNELEKNKQEDKLKGKKIYLYFQQLGKDVYTGQNIDFNMLLTNPMEYNIDHIFPQSRIKDDSYDNLVLTKSVINGEKGNYYPLPKQIQDENYNLWNYLYKKELMSSKKFNRLTRTTELTDQELEDFVNRQKQRLIGLIKKPLTY